MTFDEIFGRLAGPNADGEPRQPWKWQSDLVEKEPGNGLIRVPTGFGKTLGVLAAWVWHRVIENDDAWPRRLVWCLPMRVLVEQTQDQVKKSLAALGVLWDGHGDHTGEVGVHLLMGGADGGDWHLYPERCSVLIGTQDMLLSRALSRGYAAPRARWPMEFGLLSQDCLWVMDEVQLMDVGLATSAQLQAFRGDDAQRGKTLRPCFTWWMSATLQPGWLQKSPDTKDLVASLGESRIEPAARVGHLWEDVHKPCDVKVVSGLKALAKLVADYHMQAGRGASGPTLVVVNRVERAVDVAEALRRDRRITGTDVRLVHSRFRPAERARWRDDFLNRDASGHGTDRIIVATQVIEAGIDLSAGLLITELAPWASLVQRFGRCARWGGTASVVVADFQHEDDKAAAPYSKGELDSAREALDSIADVAPLFLEAFEEGHPDQLARLYPYSPGQLLLRHELDELFDTTPDLSGADIDISRFIRSGDERDLHVFWHEVPVKSTPLTDVEAAREELCAVPFLKAREWLCQAKAERLKRGVRAWVWDWQDGLWRNCQRRDLYPGQTVLVAAGSGGYEPERGWSPGSSRPVNPVELSTDLALDNQADTTNDEESLSAQSWKTIATHGHEAGLEARAIALCLVPRLADLLDLAGRCHDAGKIHPAFSGSIRSKPPRADLAKAPKGAWRPRNALYAMPDGTRRPGFRHELVSVLMLYSVLQRLGPDHPALLGPWRELLETAGLGSRASGPAPTRQGSKHAPTLIEQEILELDATQFDLLAYLVCAHHGKLRLAWHAGEGDQEANDEILRIRGVRQGDVLKPVLLAAHDGSLHALPAIQLDLAPAAAGLNARTGRGWTERVLALVDEHGPFTLAWLESLLRAADQRASRLMTGDPQLAGLPLEAGEGAEA